MELLSVGGPVENLYRAAWRGDEQTLEQLLQRDASILANIPFGRQTPLHISALLGHVTLTEVLLNHDRDLAIRADSSGRTALHLASAEGHIHIVKELLKVNSEPCLNGDEEGRIPLYYAATRGRTEVVQELIVARPDSLYRRDKDKTTVFHLCVIHNHLETLTTLMKLDCAAANIGHEPPSRIFKRPDTAGNTILHLAIKFKRFEAVKYLLSIPEIRELEKEENVEGLTAHDILELSPEDEKINEIKLMWTKDDDDVENPETQILNYIVNCFMKILKWIGKWLRYGGNTNWLEHMRGNLSAASIFIATITFQALINPPGGFIQQGLSSSSSSQDNATSSLSLSGPLIDCAILNVSQRYCPGEAISPVHHRDDFLSYAEYITLSFYASICVTLLLVSGVRLQNSVVIWILSILMSFTLLFLALAYNIAVKIVAPRHDTLTIISDKAFGLWSMLLGLVMVFYTLRFLFWIVSKLTNCCCCWSQCLLCCRQETNNIIHA